MKQYYLLMINNAKTSENEAFFFFFQRERKGKERSERENFPLKHPDISSHKILTENNLQRHRVTNREIINHLFLCSDITRELWSLDFFFFFFALFGVHISKSETLIPTSKLYYKLKQHHYLVSSKSCIVL